MPVRILVLLVGATLLATGCNLRPVGPSGQTPQSESAPESWRASEAITAGDLNVAVSQAGVESVHVGGVRDDARVFVARLALTNTNPTKRLAYRSWVGSALLTD